MTSLATRFDRAYAWLLVAGGSVGLLAAFQLTVEKFALLENPAHVLSCDLNPIISCGSVITSDQAAAFGFPNPFLGLIGFAVVVTIGMALFAGANFKKWFWQLFHIGTLGGVLFVHWLIFQTVYHLNALCPYCMAVWIVTIPIFWYTTLYNLRHGNITLPFRRIAAFLQENHLTILLGWYTIIVLIIVQHFWYYFETLI